MKPILILGAGRSGKTTLARQLRSKLPTYNLIHSDSVRAAIMQKLPAKYPNELLHYESNDYYSSLLLGIIEDHITQDTNNQGVILDGGYITPSFLKTSQLNAIAVYLGYGDSTPEQIFQNIRANDTPSDWSSNLTDDELKFKISYFKNLDRIFRAECKNYHYQYLDTSQNRSQVLAEASERLYSLSTN